MNQLPKKGDAVEATIRGTTLKPTIEIDLANTSRDPYHQNGRSVWLGLDQVRIIRDHLTKMLDLLW